jgi:hypothetical protein
MFKIRSINEKDEGVDILTDKVPNIVGCPFCGEKYEMRQHESFFNSRNKILQITFRCPGCKTVFIESYSANSDHEGFYFGFSRLEKKDFSKIINSISRNFVEIYNQSQRAEQLKLTLICGSGYRKALEFLIKDYLIKRNPTNIDIIKKKFLMDCIRDDVDDPKIKLSAGRATWLGNDETHYERRWDNKDVSNLKKIIDLTIYWIEMDELTRELETEMPDKSIRETKLLNN